MSEPGSVPPPAPNQLASIAEPDQLSTPPAGGPDPTARAGDSGPLAAPSEPMPPPSESDPDGDMPAGGTDGPPPADAEATTGGSGFRVSRSVIVAVVVVGALLVGGFLFRDRLSGGAGDIQVGDCFLLPAASQGQSEEQVVEEVEHRPCTEAHDAEAFFVGDLEGAADATFPDPSAIEDFVTTQCVPAFGAYTGSDFYTQQPLDAGYFSPTAESWRLADREVMCYLTPIDGSTTTQSYKAATP